MNVLDTTGLAYTVECLQHENVYRSQPDDTDGEQRLETSVGVSVGDGDPAQLRLRDGEAKQRWAGGGGSRDPERLSRSPAPVGPSVRRA